METRAFEQNPYFCLMSRKHKFKNPVEAGFVTEPQDWKYSNARYYAGIKGAVNETLVYE